MEYDIIAVGSGPAVLFCLSELLKTTRLKILLLEKARRLNDSRNVSNGWFGGSARALVHMFLEPGFGGHIHDPDILNQFTEKLQELGGPIKISKSKMPRKALKQFETHQVTLDEPNTIIYSEDKMIKLGDGLFRTLKEQATVIHKTDIISIRKNGGYFEFTTNNGCFRAPRVVMGLGRGGAEWLNDLPKNFELPSIQRDFQLGVRLEFSCQALQDIVERNYLFRLRYGAFKTTLPTVHGAVETEESLYLKTSNGRALHSSRGPLANIGIIRKFPSTSAHKELYRLVEIVNVLNDGQLFRESVTKFIEGASSLDPIPEFAALKDGVSKFVEVFPGIGARGCVYAPEARLNSIKFDVSTTMETPVKGLYIVGDMSGHTRSFVQAASSGLLAARGIGEISEKVRTPVESGSSKAD